MHGARTEPQPLAPGMPSISSTALGTDRWKPRARENSTLTGSMLYSLARRLACARARADGAQRAGLSRPRAPPHGSRPPPPRTFAAPRLTSC